MSEKDVKRLQSRVEEAEKELKREIDRVEETQAEVYRLTEREDKLKRKVREVERKMKILEVALILSWVLFFVYISKVAVGCDGVGE